MRFCLNLLICVVFPSIIFGQSATISGRINDDTEKPVPFANVMLFKSVDSTMTKAGITNENGVYQLDNLSEGDYFLEFSSLGYQKLTLNNITLAENQHLKLGVYFLQPEVEQLTEVTITASKPMVQVKADRTTFNIQGTINSVGTDGVALLNKAPGIFVDNNNNISILGRTGVLIYVNGKRLPLKGDDLANYLENIPSEQIDKIDIITNPGVQYDAEGNAGIIDIVLKKDKNLGGNGTINSSYSQGRYASMVLNAIGNFRNKKLNIFASAGVSNRKRFNESSYNNFLNNIVLYETNDFVGKSNNHNYQLGADLFLSDQHTLGTLISSNVRDGSLKAHTRTEISNAATSNLVDSTLVVNGTSNARRTQKTYNLYYHFADYGGNALQLNLDYGKYENRSNRFQPNQYFDVDNQLLSEETNSIDIPTDIDIYTIKADYETHLGQSKIELGSKVSRIRTDNTYLFFDGAIGDRIQNDQRSRQFAYTENVYAAYLNYSLPLNKKVDISVGFRAEQTHAQGDLEAFLPELEEPPVKLDYLDWFPSFRISWRVNAENRMFMSYGRRINRPDFSNLNPFNDQINLLSSEKGNPFLRPEIQNNVELGYSYKSKYNFKLTYSKTEDKITRLVGPDADEPRATFGTWENLGFQDTFGLSSNMSLNFNNWLKSYLNFSASYIDNQANFGDNAIVDLQVFSYKLYLQNSIQLPKGITGEISGYYNGPTVWGGVFEMEPNWKLDLGLQRRFFKDQLNIRLLATDIFYTSNWQGTADFNGLYYVGRGFRDSRRISVNLSYNFGNQKTRRKNREKGLENEGKRVGS
ncbi:TonB-dependent receptor [Flagellimonas nanhaiensis]|uniref:TonB-dependent receptor n=1 Tax=Flagellimonas nanhaiensis TaxID=2292706 RepID=A0A371JST2_9FLAO|nr:TonB-dependent receptor [Allomuricauda nanhaiensis]RDY60884.1 TonB-dependent receptor [Allomuricauda nanhaiensis]